MELKICRVKLGTRVVWATKWQSRKHLRSGPASLNTIQHVKLRDRISENLLKKGTILSGVTHGQLVQ